MTDSACLPAVKLQWSAENSGLFGSLGCCSWMAQCSCCRMVVIISVKSTVLYCCLIDVAASCS